MTEKHEVKMQLSARKCSETQARRVPPVQFKPYPLYKDQGQIRLYPA